MNAPALLQPEPIGGCGGGIRCAQAGEKAFTTLAARAALRGWQLWRSDAADGHRRYFVGRWDVVHVLADLGEIERCIEREGGPA